MQIGNRYRWPDGTIIELVSITRTGKFNTRYEAQPHDEFDEWIDPYGVSVGSVSPADLEVLIKNNIVSVVED